jgi:hypothetical protein
MMALALQSSVTGAVWCCLLMEPCKACRRMNCTVPGCACCWVDVPFSTAAQDGGSGRLLLRPATPQCFVALQWLRAWLCLEDLTVHSV